MIQKLIIKFTNAPTTSMQNTSPNSLCFPTENQFQILNKQLNSLSCGSPENEMDHNLSCRSLIDSCHGRVMRNQQNLYSLVPPTAVVKLLQHSGLGSNTGMGFHPMNDVHQCLKMVRLLFWIFGFGQKQWELFGY